MKYKVLGVTGAAIVGSIMLADSAEASQNQGVVNADVLNIRSGANTSHSVIGKAYNGQALTIVGEVNGWYKINHQGKVGYVSGAFVKKQAPPTVSAPTTGTYRVTANVLNVRSGSNTSHSIIGKMYRGHEVAVIGKENGWYKVNHNGQTGYVSAEYMQKVGEGSSSTSVEKPSPPPPPPPTSSGSLGTYIVTASTLNVRQGPNTSYQKVGALYNQQKVTVLGETNGWYKIEYKGQTGYISSSFAKKHTGDVPEVTPPPPPSATLDINGMINYAKTLIGTPYVFGGSKPSTGLDCSGFIYHVLNQAGKKIGRTNVEGYWNSSKYFTKIDSPQAGDLIFFQNTYRIGPSHIGIMVDNSGNFIHANDGTGVAISSMHSKYYKQKFLGFKRIN
jgi:uncharacterized protein YgiM (DUF1202 family)